jgi:hypothetical protein
MEKNNVLLYGRTFKELNIVDGNIKVTVPHRLDVVIDPRTDPLDIETAQHLEKLHIFKRLKTILASSKYTQLAKDKLKIHLQARDEGNGVIMFTEDDTMESRRATLQSLGVDNFEDLFAADIEIELNEHFTLIWDKDEKKFVRYVVVVADESVILYCKSLKETLGIEFWPFTTWGDDLDSDDFWNDGMGDIIRTPNKVMNGYFSSMLESWAYRSLGMSWYLPIAGYDPQTFTPEPFGQYPAPLIPDGRGGYLSVEQVIKQMEIPELNDNMVSIEFLIKIVERATAATAIEKGVQEKGQMTLGEVEQLVQSTTERIVSIAKFYRRSWKEFAYKWREMLKAAHQSTNKPFILYKKGANDNYYEKKIYPKDWISAQGYKERVKSSTEQEKENNKTLQKAAYLKQNYPDNVAVQKVVLRRVIGDMNLSPDEMKEIEDFEENKLKAAQIPTATGELDQAVVPGAGLRKPLEAVKPE